MNGSIWGAGSNLILRPDNRIQFLGFQNGFIPLRSSLSDTSKSNFSPVVAGNSYNGFGPYAAPEIHIMGNSSDFKVVAVAPEYMNPSDVTSCVFYSDLKGFNNAPFNTYVHRFLNRTQFPLGPIPLNSSLLSSTQISTL